MGRCPPPEALRSSRSCVSSMPSILQRPQPQSHRPRSPGPARVRRGAAGRATSLSTTLTSHISENSLLQKSRRGSPRRVPSGPPRERVEATGPRPKTTEPLTGESKTQDLDNCRQRLGGPADQHADPSFMNRHHYGVDLAQGSVLPMEKRKASRKRPGTAGHPVSGGVRPCRWSGSRRLVPAR